MPDSLDLYADRRGEAPRPVDLPEELTSRVSQRDIVALLTRLSRESSDPDCVDVVLATNMVSVGVDVPRLGLMLVNGQPKTRSEYIQATSRVGRSRFPGLVVSVMNAAKGRDRSHFETFPSWHDALYRDVEATSVTPFASRARDKALRAVLVSMIRHGGAGLSDPPDLPTVSTEQIEAVVQEIERRVEAVDEHEVDDTRSELDEALGTWEAISPRFFHHRYKPRDSLMQYAEDAARRVAAGRLAGQAWPTPNTMRGVEPSTPFRLVERLQERPARPERPKGTGDPQSSAEPRWRRKRG